MSGVMPLRLRLSAKTLGHMVSKLTTSACPVKHEMHKRYACERTIRLHLSTCLCCKMQGRVALVVRQIQVDSREVDEFAGHQQLAVHSGYHEP